MTICSPKPSPSKGQSCRTDLRLQIVEGGFPHSEIRGSKVVRTSPRLIAAYHVLHRLSAPRHPPNALKALDRSHDRCPRDQLAKTYDQKDHLCLPNVPDSTRADGVGLLARCRMSSSRIHSLFTMTNSSAHRRCRRKAKLEYFPDLVEPDGIEPTTSCLQSTRSPS